MGEGGGGYATIMGTRILLPSRPASPTDSILYAGTAAGVAPEGSEE